MKKVILGVLAALCIGMTGCTTSTDYAKSVNVIIEACKNGGTLQYSMEVGSFTDSFRVTCTKLVTPEVD